MVNQILNSDQQNILPLIEMFSSNYYLVGGTAIALHLGHRRSIDFDLFTNNTFNPIEVRNKVLADYHIDHTFSQGQGELTVLINKVKITFLHYPFTIDHPIVFHQHIKLPDLLTLGAMKAFALGKRAKWKDYVDLYFIFQQYSLSQVINRSRDIFKTEFNERLFRTQLGYFNDIDYSETIEYMDNCAKSDNEIKQYLEKISLSSD